MRTGIIVLSDRCSSGQCQDLSGPLLEKLVVDEGWELVWRKLMPDDLEPLSRLLCLWADEEKLDLILTSGGTGISPRDQTPEATRKILDREIPGIPEALRGLSLIKHPTACLSRMLAGIRANTLIVNLPGSPRALEEVWPFLAGVLPHALKVAGGDPTDCGRE